MSNVFLLQTPVYLLGVVSVGLCLDLIPITASEADKTSFRSQWKW